MMTYFIVKLKKKIIYSNIYFDWEKKISSISVNYFKIFYKSFFFAINERAKYWTWDKFKKKERN